MERRKFLKKAGVVGAAAASAASGFAAPAIAQGIKEVKMVTTWPKNFPGLGTAAERLATRITSGSEGKLQVKVFAAGELVPPFESFDAVSQGNAKMYHGAEYYWQGKSKAFNFFAAVPFGLTATEMNAWVYHGGGQELWDELGAEFDLKPFMAANTGVQLRRFSNDLLNRIGEILGEVVAEVGASDAMTRRVYARVS